MNVVMVGAGYVGLVTGACFSEFGANVSCVDLDKDRIDGLARGEMPIYEPGLESLVSRNCQSGRLTFTTDLGAAVAEADLVFIAVGTPARRGDGHADLRYVYSAAEDIAPYLNGYTVIVDKSTVPVGTARQVERLIKAANPEADFDVACNPEFLREGAAISDFMRPDRVVLGVESERAENLLRELYRPLNLIDTPILVAALESAELIKYAANVFLATKISFINEISQLCEVVGADVHDIARGIGLDDRIGKKFLHTGPGYGGSCFPKDSQAFIRIAQEHGVTSRIVESVVEVNAAHKAKMVQKIRKALGGSESGKVIAVLGLAFKPETDDMRDAPALSILPPLLDRGAIIRAHDPKAIEEARSLLPAAVTYCSSVDEALADADAVVLLTEWNEYRGLDPRHIRSQLKGDVFVDLRNIYEPAVMRGHGFNYHCVGRQ